MNIVNTKNDTIGNIVYLVTDAMGAPITEGSSLSAHKHLTSLQCIKHCSAALDASCYQCLKPMFQNGKKGSNLRKTVTI